MSPQLGLVFKKGRGAVLLTPSFLFVQTSNRTDTLKSDLQVLQTLKKTTTDIVRLVRECQDLDKECRHLMSELSASGTTATSEDIQGQLAALGEKM